MLESMLLSKAHRDKLETATAAYAEQLTYDEEAVEYLEGRGIVAEVAIDRRIGVVRTPATGHDPYVNHISIPYITPSGVVSIKFRNLDLDAKPKYNQPSGQHPRLYGVMDLQRPSNVVAVVEGEFDQIIMSALVGVPAVAAPGVNGWFQHMPRCLEDYDRVIAMGDNDADKDDNPGKVFAEKVAKTCDNGEVILPPPGHDVTSWYLGSTRETILDRMGLDPSDFPVTL